ncbi:MAG: hypothetical protein ABI613_07960 [Gemmatimonadota bacterium]
MSDWASTERIPARVILAEGIHVEGELHVQARVGLHEGPETVLEMLNRTDHFFPVSIPDGGVAFAAKSQVAVVVCAAGIGMTDPERVGAAKTVNLEVGMAGGAEYRGWATIELPPSRARALDYLNAAGLFFVLRSHESTWLINRTYVRGVRPLD